MNNGTSKLSKRILAAFLSAIMILSLAPVSMLTAFAATTEHPDAITITVVDEDGTAVEGATVQFAVDSVAYGEDYMFGSETTDANGCVEIMASSAFVADDFTISATASKTDYIDGAITDESISSSDANFEIAITSTLIKDVTVTSNSGLVYTGEPLSLVTISGNKATDTITYKIDDIDSEKAEKTDAGDYKVEVTVKREGFTDLVKTFSKVSIAKADIENVDINAKSNLKYNGSDLELVDYTNTGVLPTDTITWYLDSSIEASIPKASAIGNYSVKLVVSRNSNYNDFEKTVNVSIALGEIDLGDLNITANDITYNGTEQKAIEVKNQGDYTLKYSFEETGTFTTFTNDADYPTVKDVKEDGYTIYVKAVKDSNYNEKQYPTYPINVKVAKASQTLELVNYSKQDRLEVVLNSDPQKNIYDLSAVGENLSGKEIVYSSTDNSIVSVDTDGIATVVKAGVATITAKRAGNDNYADAEIGILVVVKVPSDGLVSFAESIINYTLEDSTTVSEAVATKANADDNGKLSYKIDKTNIGLSVDSENGKVSISDIKKLNKAIKNSSGTVSVTVTVEKAAGTKTTKETHWFFIIPYQEDVTVDIYPKSSASYTLLISRESALSFDDVFTILPASETGWYNSTCPATISLKDISAYEFAIDEPEGFTSNPQTITEQGNKTHELYIKVKGTKKVLAPTLIDVKVDTVKPTNLNIQFHNTKEENFIQKVGELLGFYNPSVTITFSAEDATSGLDHFDWTYTPEEGTPVTKPITLKSDGTAELTLPADQAEQLHGKISFTATDKAGNEIGKTDSNYVFIVDTIAPELSVKYQGKVPYEAQADTYNNAHFFNSDVEVELTVTETNFYKDDVVVKVSKNGGAASAVTPSWTDKVGKITLSGDGDYIIYVTYSDKSNNKAEYTSEVITVDKIKPVVKIDYVHDGDDQKTVFTVTEHNFRASDVTITGTMKDITGVDVSFTATQLTEILRDATWTKNGDTYTTEYDAYVSGIYDLNIDYKDISGWEATQANERFTIDHNAPTNIKIEYAKSTLDTFLEVITLGFYNPSVTVRFTAYDTSSGVKSFTWGYTKQTGASTIKHPENLADKTVDAVQDQTDKSKFTAEVTLTANEAAQYRGYISTLATDNFGNKSDKKTDDGNIIVVDTIAPEITVEYTESDRVINSNEYFYNNAVDVKFTVTEANFYADDVVVSVTKNGNAFDYGTVTWGSRNAADKTIGTFTLPAPADHSGDGHYVITVEYKDRSNNEMVKYVSDTHTIDTTAPVIDVKYNDDKVAVANTLIDQDGNTRKYYADTKTATVTITEHNFIAEEVDFTIVAKDVTGAELDATKLNSKTSWSVDSTGDVHTITITYPGDANYSFDVAYTDKATNVAEDYLTDYFTVDKTAPTNLTVSYSTSVLDTILESVTFGFYNAKMTVTLTAEDPTAEVHSFLYSYMNASGVSGVNAQLINEAIQSADIKYSDDRKTATVTFEIPKMVLGNDNQFNGTVEFTATDRAGNETKSHKETKRIVVDNIAPTATVTYNTPVNQENGISYYDGSINGTITINEANFYSDDVKVTVTKDGGVATALPTTWKDESVDVHIGTFTLTDDADYVISITYKDKSENEMVKYESNQLTIDTKIEAPTYSINGVAKSDDNGGAYKDDISVSYSFADQNYDSNTVKLTRTRFDKTEDVTSEYIKTSLNDKGGSGTFTFAKETANDGIYVLTATMKDKAGHTTESHVKFTVNRYGSVYEYSDYLVSLIKDGGQYIKKNGDAAITQDIVITEYNADRISADSLKILITRDGEKVDTEFKSNPVASDTTQIGESGWYQYEYTISKSNFAKDGVYNITLTSKDNTGNESTSVPENSFDSASKQIADTMKFTVDTTTPEIRNVVNLDKEIVNAQELNVKYTVVDVGGLAKIEVIVNGKAVDTITDFGDDLNNYTGDFTISESNSAQTVQLKVTDLAGNITDTASDSFNPGDKYIFNDVITVSTNFFVRWYANTPLFWGSIGGVVVLAAGCWLFIAKRKKIATK